MSNVKKADALLRLPLNLVPPIFVCGVAEVLAEGAQRPGRTPYNWRDDAIDLTDYISAMYRHLLALQAGEDVCPKSGKPHWAHISANCAIIADAESVGKLTDDRRTEPHNVPSMIRDYEQAQRDSRK